MYFVKVRDMENNTAKLAYQKPLVELLEVCEIIKNANGAGDDGLGGGLF